ncbi:plasmid transfer protein TraA [Streptomyces sp. GbtcB6]|uniref:plasmid transfer protein TraA n=1 Tax=Streptomyces sp. GbtcB6 TaxID=2824751 RepID=UPI001C307187|nr:plasmid transfer protein TraA [Streptomyces sp. GbtcB6]
MADNGSANRAANRQYRQQQQARNPFVDAATGAKGTKNFTGFAPSFGLNVNVQANRNGGSGSSGSGGSGQNASHFVLGEPQFASTDDVRTYCNHVRALMLQASIELAIAAKILEARLGQAQPLPGDNAVQTKLRARKVARKLKKAGDGATAAAKNAVAAYGAFQREYADLMRPRPQRQAPSVNPFQF